MGGIGLQQGVFSVVRSVGGGPLLAFSTYASGNFEAPRWFRVRHLGDRLSAFRPVPLRRHGWCQRTHRSYCKLSTLGRLASCYACRIALCARRRHRRRVGPEAVLWRWNMEHSSTGKESFLCPTGSRPDGTILGDRRDWRVTLMVARTTSKRGHRRIPFWSSVVWSASGVVAPWVRRHPRLVN